MPTARLQATFGKSLIEEDKGIIRGVKVMELGMLAMFAGEDGKARSVTISEKHINALLSHAGNRAIPSHWSHDWYDSKADPIHARVGALKEFRKDDSGSLVADLHLSPGEHRDTALWNAVNAPGNMMLSAVFDYAKNDSNYLPTNFQAADLVAKGAATTALFSKTNEPETMELKDFVALLKTALSDKDQGPELKTALLSAMPEHKEPDGNELSKMEVEAGVTDEDKVASDDQKPALMRSYSRIGRALSRKAKSLETSKTALLEEFKTIAKSEATGLLGNTEFLRSVGNASTGKDATAKFNGFVKELTDKGVKPAAAIQTIIDREPDLYAETQRALFSAPARL